MKRILTITIIILAVFITGYCQTGSYTTHDLFYLPEYGASGTTEYDEYNTYMEIADQQIWANKEAIEGIEGGATTEVELETQLTDVTDVYTDNDFDIADYLLVANKYTDAEAVAAIKADEDWNATDWDLAYGWGDHSVEGYLTAETDPSFVDWTVSQAPTVIHADNYTDTTYTAGTGLDLTLLEFSLNASIDDLNDVDTTGWASGKVLKFDESGDLVVGTDEGGAGATTFVGMTDTPANYTDAANKFVQVNATPDAIIFDTISSADLSDVSSIAMLDEAEEITAAWTLGTGGSIAGVDSTEMGILNGATLSTTDINIIDGISDSGSLTAAELLYVDGVTSSIQTQLGDKLEDITGESLLDLSDTPSEFETGKYLRSTADGTIWDSALGVDTYGTPVDNDFAKFTDENTIEGRSYSETRNDLQNYTVYPQDYATGSGTSGDPWAGSCIEDAYTAASAGDTIYLREGYYQMAGDLSIAKKISIIGEGIGKTFIIAAADEFVFNVSNTDYCTFKGFTIDGENLTGTYGYCLNVSGSDYTVIENVEVKNAHLVGLNLVNVNNSRVRNIIAHDNGEDGVHIGGNTANDYKYNILENIWAYNNTDTGLDVYSTAEAEPSTPGQHNIYNNIIAWDNNQGIAVWGDYHCVLSNSSAYSNTTNGFYLFYMEDSQVSNCMSILNGGTGILIYGNNINFNNCTVKNNDTGIAAYASDGLIFSNCQAYDDDGSTTQDYAFQFHEYESTACTNIKINNCKITGNAVGTIYDADSSATYTVDGISDGEQATTGDIQYFNGTNWVRLAKGTEGQVLEMGGSNIPEWDTDDELTEEEVEDFAGGMLGGTETLITVTYQDETNDIDFVVDADLHNYTWTNVVDADITDTLTCSSCTGTSDVATHVTITDNEDTAENNPLVFVEDADPDGGNIGLESDGTCYYTPSTGVITTTGFAGALTGNADTCTTASAGDAAADFFGAGVHAVTDGTACTDIEGTGLSIATGTLNWAANIADLSDIPAPEAADDEEFLKYDHDTTSYSWAAAGGAATAWDDIGNPDANDEIDFTTYTIELSMDDGGLFQVGDGGGTNFVQINHTGALTFGGTGDIDLPNDSVDAADINTINCGTLCTWDADNDEIDIDTAAVTDDDTTHVPTCDGVYEFCETTQNYMQNTVEDTTPQLGGDLDMNEKNIIMDSTLTDDHSWSGITESWAVGETVAFGDILYFNFTDKEWKKAKADAAATTPGLRIALEAKNDGEACKLLVQGYIRDDSWNFTAKDVYLSDGTAGGVLSAAPSDAGDQVQRLGIAVHADKMYFYPSIDVGEI